MQLPDEPDSNRTTEMPTAAGNPDADNIVTQFHPSQSASPPVPHPAPHEPSNDEQVPNILIFGQTGTGKSSVINMLNGKKVAESSPDARGCTFSSTPYFLALPHGDGGDTRKYCIWDTAGLNEDAAGSVSPEQAVNKLLELTQNIQGRLHLLLYCIRATRYHKVIKDNYDLFCDMVAQRKVPIVLVVTGCEHFEDMNMWWKENKFMFDRHKLTFSEVVCITATRGRLKDGEWTYEEQYLESQSLLRDVIPGHCMDKGYVVPPTKEKWTEYLTNRFVLALPSRSSDRSMEV